MIQCLTKMIEKLQLQHGHRFKRIQVLISESENLVDRCI